MAEFIEELNVSSADTSIPDVIKGAMAHLNF